MRTVPGQLHAQHSSVVRGSGRISRANALRAGSGHRYSQSPRKFCCASRDLAHVKAHVYHMLLLLCRTPVQRTQILQHVVASVPTKQGMPAVDC